MNKKVIIEKDNEIAYDYLVNNYAGSGIKFKLKKSYSFIFFDIDLGDSQLESFLNHTAKAIILWGKYNAITSAFTGVELGFANVACLAALLYFDIEGELEQVLKVIGGKDTISVEGTLNFKLDDLRDSWEELKSIGEVLVYNESEQDIYNVTNFLMSNRSGDKSLFLAQYPDILLANVSDGVMVENIKLYKNDDFNLINTIVAECPTELIIEKNQIKNPLYDCLSNIIKIRML